MHLGYLRMELVARETNFLVVRLELSVPPWKGRGLEVELITDYKVVVQLSSCGQFFATPRTPSFPVSHYLPELAQGHVHNPTISSVMPSNHLILCHPLLPLPSIFPSIKVFSNELALHIRRLKYGSFSFSISPSKEYSGLISFKIDWFDLLAVHELSRVFSSTTI